MKNLEKNSTTTSPSDTKVVEFSNEKSVPFKQDDENSNGETISTYDSIRFIARDAMYGYVFWSVFMAIPPMIWFYPLNEMEISGYEAFAGFYLTPVLCLVPGVKTLVQNRWVLCLLRMLTVCSLCSFQAPTTLTRLVILAVGAGTGMLALAGSLWHPCRDVRQRTYGGLMVGMHAYLASRVWGSSFLPTWWDSRSNSVVTALGVIAVLGYATEGNPKASLPASLPPNAKSHGSWVRGGVGLGSLVHLTHWMFGEASLLARWTVQAHPHTGPSPLPAGSLVLLFLLLGSVRGPLPRQSYLGSPLLNNILATACFFILYLSPWPYIAYIAGCVLAYLTMCLWPVVVDVATLSHPGLCLTLAALIYIVQVLAWVWTVAYNFVPLGVYMREHTGFVIAFTMGGILIALLFSSDTDSHSVKPHIRRSTTVPSHKHYALALVCVCLVGQAGILYRTMHYTPGQSQGRQLPNRTFSAAIWTFHFGYDNKGWPSMERAAQLLNDTGADVITLLESDASKHFLGNHDLGQWMAERLQMYQDFGPSTKDHTWGNLVLSKYPIVKSVHHLLPSPHGELAPALTVTVSIGGTLVDFVVTHMGNDRDRLDRKLQAEVLAGELRNSPRSAVFLGYVTSEPGSQNYRHLLVQGGVKDIDPTDRDRWCEYIMYKKLIRLGYARITHGGLSDTEVQMATFRLPDDPENFTDNSLTTIKEDTFSLDPALRFNSKFGGHHRGHGHFPHHGFHMNTPKYFYNKEVEN